MMMMKKEDRFEWVIRINVVNIIIIIKIGDSSISIVTGLRVRRPGFDFREGQIFLSSSPRPDRLWGPPSFYSVGTGELSPRVKGRSMKVITHLHLIHRLRLCGAIPPLPQCLHGVMLNKAPGIFLSE
jgi:hypothetical protein